MTNMRVTLVTLGSCNPTKKGDKGHAEAKVLPRATRLRTQRISIGVHCAGTLIPAPLAVKSTATKDKQNDENDQKRGSIHDRLLAETKRAKRV